MTTKCHKLLHDTLMPIYGVFANVFLTELIANDEFVGARSVRDRVREVMFNEEGNAARGKDNFESK